MQTINLEKQKLIKMYYEDIVLFLCSQEKLRKKTLCGFILLKLASIFMFIFNFIIIYTFLYWSCTNFIEYKIFNFLLLFLILNGGFYLSNMLNEKAKQLKQKYQNFVKKSYIDKILNEIQNFKNITTNETSQDRSEYKLWEKVYCRTHTDISQRFIRYSYENIVDNDMFLYETPKVNAYLNKITLTKFAHVKFIFFNKNIFTGLVVSIDIPKKINNKILITTNIYSSSLDTDKLKKNKNLSKNLKLYTKNKLDVEFITPEFISLIENLIKCFRTKNINFLISKNKIFITIESKKDIFEITDLSKNPRNFKQFKNFLDEIYVLKQIFRYLEFL